MTTNADLSHPEIKNTCERDCAFTLTDLLVVMATLAILAALILPALAGSGGNGARTVCLNNLRRLGTALNMYASENQDYMPWVDWTGSGGEPPGWLFGGYGNTPNNLNTGNAANDASLWSTGRVANLKTGVYWQYLQNPDVFICPIDALSVGTSRWDGRYNQLSTYLMNGAAGFFPSMGSDTYGYRTAKMSQIWSPQCIINWEPSGTSGMQYGYNDGASYPDSNEGPSIVLHVTGANVLTVGGSTRFMSFADLTAEMNHPNQNDCTRGKGLLWWNPQRCDGHGNQE